LPKDFLSLIEKYQQEKKPVKRFNVHLINHNVFEIDYIPVFSTSQFQGHLWLFKDITDLKQLQDQTQQQQDFYEKVLNNLPADISIFDSNHKYLFANKQAVSKDDMREWLIGKDDFDYSLSLNEGFEKAISRRNYFEQSVQTNQTIQFEEKIVNTDGKEIYNLRHFYPYINPQKQVEFVVGYGVNISKIRQNEKLLVRSVETYQKLLNDLDEVVFIIDGNNQLQYVNPLWERVWGKSYYESVGNPITNFFNKENTQLLNEDINALRLENGSDKIKRIIKVDLPNGETKHFQYYLRRFYSLYKEELRVSGFMVDITDQIKVQEELLNILEKERQLSDMKTVFVNMVSHELRTPLSIIQSSAEILELLYQDKATNETELQAYTHRIVEEVKNLKDLMDELLLVSRIEANKINFNPDEIDITAFVNDLTNQQYRPWRDGRNLLLETRGNGKLVKADKFMMRHLLNNIIDNAFKYSPNKAEPIVRIFFGQENWSIVCRDHGIGIPSKDINDLGTSFKRGANVGSIQGTGLGLVVVRYFVEKHNGTIEYQSEEGQGTIVRIHFPY
jgi:PAS domain S-box-containing protein